MQSTGMAFIGVRMYVCVRVCLLVKCFPWHTGTHTHNYMRGNHTMQKQLLSVFLTHGALCQGEGTTQTAWMTTVLAKQMYDLCVL